MHADDASSLQAAAGAAIWGSYRGSSQNRLPVAGAASNPGDGSLAVSAPSASSIAPSSIARLRSERAALQQRASAASGTEALSLGMQALRVRATDETSCLWIDLLRLA